MDFSTKTSSWVREAYKAVDDVEHRYNGGRGHGVTMLRIALQRELSSRQYDGKETIIDIPIAKSFFSLIKIEAFCFDDGKWATRSEYSYKDGGCSSPFGGEFASRDEAIKSEKHSIGRSIRCLHRHDKKSFIAIINALKKPEKQTQQAMF